MPDPGHFYELPLFRPLRQCLTLPEPGKDFRDCHHVLELFVDVGRGDATIMRGTAIIAQGINKLLACAALNPRAPQTANGSAPEIT